MYQACATVDNSAHVCSPVLPSCMHACTFIMYFACMYVPSSCVYECTFIAYACTVPPSSMYACTFIGACTSFSSRAWAASATARNTCPIFDLFKGESYVFCLQSSVAAVRVRWSIVVLDGPPCYEQELMLRAYCSISQIL